MKILLTGAGGPAAIGVARSLLAHELVGMDCDRYALRFAETPVRVLGPRASDPAYIDFLNDLTAQHGIDLIHAQPDPEVLAISENRERLRARTFLPPKEVVRVCQDKWRTYAALSEKGVPVPRSLFLTDEIGLNQAWDALMPENGKMWLRATTGAAGRGAYPVSGHGKYDQARAWIDSQHGWGGFMAAEHLPGRCVTWQSLWKNGELISAQGRERLEWHLANRSPSGVTGITGVGRTVTRLDMTEIGRAACLAVDPQPSGIYGVDMKENAAGVPCVTEINIGRFFTTIQFFAALGLNFPEMYVRLAMGESVEAQRQLDDGWLWLRSMDAQPLLIHESDL